MMNKLKMSGQKKITELLINYSPLYSVVQTGKYYWRGIRQTLNCLENSDCVRQIKIIEHEIGNTEIRRKQNQCPVMFFNPSSDLVNIGFNTLFCLLTAWSLRLTGKPVTYLTCRGGLGKCVLGTNRLHPGKPPPCKMCIAHNKLLYPSQYSHTLPINKHRIQQWKSELASLTIKELEKFKYHGFKVGTLCIPSARWALRRHSLDDNGLKVLREYIASAVTLVETLEQLFEIQQPRALVLFNGTFFPEATARAVAVKHGIPVVTYETGFRELSAFYSHGLATEYPIEVPSSFAMGSAENTELDIYFSRRIKGNFTMAGINFWPEMKSLSREIIQKANDHRQMVTMFTNVIFDTSQIFANTVFSDMFDWLKETLQIASQNKDTLFIIRAHPDEARPDKASEETVEQWLKESGYIKLPNLMFIPPDEYISSYDLIQLSRFCLIYNSTIGIEATILGKPVVAGGRSRYSKVGFTYEPSHHTEYRKTLNHFLRTGAVCLPDAWINRARRYLYYSLFRTSLDFSGFMEPINRYEYTLKSISTEALDPHRSEEMRIICNGIMNLEPFHYKR